MSRFPEEGAIFDLLDVLRQEKNHGASEVHLFGSRARGDNNPGSDVDLASDVDLGARRESETEQGRRSGVYFSIERKSRGESFLNPDLPHRTIHLGRKRK